MKDTFIIRKKYRNQIQNLTWNQRRELMDCIFSYQLDWLYESGDGAICMLMDIMIDEWKTDDEKYSEVCERNKENWKRWWRPSKNHKNPVGLEKTKKADYDSDSDIKEKEIDKSISKKKEIPKIDELVEAYREDERINEAFLEEDIIEWLKFKRWRKEYYATTKSFLQQMIVIKRMITNGKPQLDIPKRFYFAVNNAIGYGWKWIHRDDNTERQYLASKKDLFKTPNQDE